MFAKLDTIFMMGRFKELIERYSSSFVPHISFFREKYQPLQSPLSTDSSPSPVVPFQSLLEDRTRKLSPSELPSERGIITFTLSYDPVSLALQVSRHMHFFPWRCRSCALNRRLLVNCGCIAAIAA